MMLLTFLSLTSINLSLYQNLVYVVSSEQMSKKVGSPLNQCKIHHIFAGSLDEIFTVPRKKKLCRLLFEVYRIEAFCL